MDGKWEKSSGVLNFYTLTRGIGCASKEFRLVSTGPSKCVENGCSSYKKCEFETHIRIMKILCVIKEE